MDRLTRDGVGLVFRDVGKGAPPLMLVHGFGGDHTCLAPQLEHFRRAHRVVAVDLRGHGRSGRPRQDYTIPRYAEDLRWLGYELGVYRPVIVGHGLGGMIALECAARYPRLPAAIVALDAALVPLGGAETVRRSLAREQRAAAACLPTQTRRVRRSCPAGEDRVGAHAPRASSIFPAHVACSIREHAPAWNSAAAAADCTLPLLYVGAGAPSADLTRLGALCPRLVVGRTVEDGQINAIIERFLTQIAETQPAAAFAGSSAIAQRGASGNA